MTFLLKSFAACLLLGTVQAAVHEVEFLSANENWIFEPLIKTKLVDERCTSLPHWAANKAVAIKNKNKCVMLFSHPNCEGRSYEAPAGSDLLHLKYFVKEVDSVRLCKKHEIGRTNNWQNNDADATSYEDLSLKKITFFESSNHRDVLADIVISPYCRTLDMGDWNKVTSIVTEECVMLYTMPHCQGFSFEVSENTTYLTHFNDLTQSFRPCTRESILGEPNLSIQVTKFKYFNVGGQKNKQKPKTLKNKMFVTNNGTAALKKAVEVVFEDKQKTIMSWGEMSSVAHTVSVSSTVEVESEVKIPFAGQSTVTASLTAGYEYQTGKETTKGEEKQITEKKVIKLNDELELRPCTKYELRSYAKVMKGYPVKFETELEVKGMQGERRMWANEVKAKLSSKVTYLRTKDDYTVIAQGKGMIILDFKVDSNIVAHGKKIPVENCERY